MIWNSEQRWNSCFSIVWWYRFLSSTHRLALAAWPTKRKRKEYPEKKKEKIIFIEIFRQIGRRDIEGRRTVQCFLEKPMGGGRGKRMPWWHTANPSSSFQPYLEGKLSARNLGWRMNGVTHPRRGRCSDSLRPFLGLFVISVSCLVHDLGQGQDSVINGNAEKKSAIASEQLGSSKI